MSEVSNNQILQAISELSEEVKGISLGLKNVESRLSDRIDRNAGKIDRVNTKLSVLSDELLETKAEVKILKNAK